MERSISIFFTCFFTILTFTIDAQVSINNTGSDPDPSAMLDIQSTDKGMLVPRLSTSQRNNITNSAATGLLVYDTNRNSFYYHDGTKWTPIIAGNNIDVDPTNEFQTLAVSISGDTLFITDGNYVVIPGLSSSNSGTAFANAGPDIYNSCQTQINLNGSDFPIDATVLWSIISGSGGIIQTPTFKNTTFTGLEGESYELEYKVTFNGGSEAFDRKNISIVTYTTTSVADAGTDQLAISSTSTQLGGNATGVGSQGRWVIQSGNNGLLVDDTDPTTTFTGVKGEVYTLRWEHYNDCSTSSDQVIISISSLAQGVVSSTGRYYIPDDRFRAYLIALYPTIMDGDSLIVNLATPISTINIQNLDVTNLDGIQFFTGLLYLNCSDNYSLTEIPYFSDALTRFECDNCSSLTSIPFFPTTLDTLKLSDLDQLSAMPDFPSGLKYLNVHGYNQNTFPEIPDACEYVFLNDLNSLTATLNIPSMTIEFYLEAAENLLTFPTLPGNKNSLQRLTISGTTIFSMPSLCEFVNLKFLEISNSNILELGALPIGLEELYTYGNPLVCVNNKPPGVISALLAYPICAGSDECQNEVSTTGKYNIIDNLFRTYLQIAYPAIMDGDSLMVAMAATVTKIDIQNLGVSNLDGLRFFTGLTYLNCSNNNVAVVPFFSDVLTRFECNNCNNLFSIPDFPSTLDSLMLEGIRDLSSMPAFPVGLKFLNVFNFSLNTFPIIPDSCEFINLVSLPNLTSQLNIPSHAVQFYIGQTNSIFPSLPIDKTNLKILFMRNTSNSSMPSLYDFINLENLDLGNNALLKLELLPEGLLDLNISGNPLLCVENKPIGVAAVLSSYPICP